MPDEPLRLNMAESAQESRNYHVLPTDGKTHEVSEDCACEPMLLMDYGEGCRLWLHRRQGGLENG